jgi:hypothetical protein
MECDAYLSEHDGAPFSLLSSLPHQCLHFTPQDALKRRSLAGMAQCWSSGTSYDNFPKSADFACE